MNPDIFNAALPAPDGMTAQERRASVTLASIYGLRMLGLFLILPVFAIYARTLPHGGNHALVGLALGIYGLTQAALQIPFGIASDHYGRKSVMIVGLLIFAFGSFVAGAGGLVSNLPLIVVGRAAQGAGAISAAISAMIADATRPQHRTKAMATVGLMIGASFFIALLLGPVLYRGIGVPGMFILTGLLALLAILVVRYIVPDTPMVDPAEELPAGARLDLFATPILRLHFSIFALNFMQVAMFLAVPPALADYAHIPLQNHWMVYLPTALGGFVLAIPGIVWAEKRGLMRPVLMAAVLLLVLAMLGFAFGYRHEGALVVALFGFFIAFNLLEALLPSLVSRTAPPSRKGLVIGVYNTAQSLGLFAGGVLGGTAMAWGGTVSVFLLCAVLGVAWLAVALFISSPPRSATPPHNDRSLTRRDRRSF